MSVNGAPSAMGTQYRAPGPVRCHSTDAPVDDKLSTFQRQKFDHLFHVLYDTTSDKTLSRADFLELLQKVEHLRGWQDGSRESTLAAQSLSRAWAALFKGSRSYRSRDLQMHIRLSEWRRYWGDWVEAARQTGGWPDTSLDGEVDYTWQREYTVFMFQLMDTNGDSSIDKDEYAKCFGIFGLDSEQCHKAFSKFARDDEGSSLEEVTLDRFEELWFQYLLSDDLHQHPGNYLMGKVDFEEAK